MKIVVPASGKWTSQWKRFFADLLNIQDWFSPTFQNSWASVGSPYPDAGYTRDPWGWVHMRGRIDSGASATVAFTLPSGFRPVGTQVFISEGSTTPAQISIASNGQVTPTVGGAGIWVQLDQVRFRID